MTTADLPAAVTYVTMSGMKRLNQQGMSALLLPFIIVVVLLLATGGFAVWAYQGKQKYQYHADQVVASAVSVAKANQSKTDQAQYNELEKQPYVTYTGPEAYGSIKVTYPKTWSSYVDTSGSGVNQAAVDGYFYPGTVPSITAKDSVFALRLEVVQSGYSQVLQTLSGQQTPPTSSPYALPKVPSVIGVKLVGSLGNNKTGTMVVLPLRDKTLEIWTEGQQFTNDFNNIILPNLTFSP